MLVYSNRLREGFSIRSSNLEMKGTTVFHFSTVMLIPQPHTLFSTFPIFPSATTPRKPQSLQSLKFPRKWNRDMGDCVVFEDGIFEDTIFQNDNGSINKPINRPKKGIVRENLVPDKWREDKRRESEAETSITNNKRHKKMELKRKVQKKGNVKPRELDINWDEYRASKKAKLAQLKPLVLDKPSSFLVREKVPEPDLNGERVVPKNPRGVVYGKGLEHVTEFFNSGSYNPTAKTTGEGRRRLFTITKEEAVLLNKRTPYLAAATSGKWHPLHTLAACGELYLLDSLLKHNVDINAVDKSGLTVLHKAIANRQAITNYLLRNSANPFVQDKEGATLMHYAVQTASTETIELLLLYNVDINLQDKDGWTPLHLAVQTQRADIVRLLLIKGADKTLRNKDGLTPLDLCLYSGQSFQTYVLIKLLKQPQGHL
ncbi:hypothetical protein VNO77_40536 [Canavalia gladiata]|uniref:Ankyrin repeat domain-containing protein, chloroplastic n=1 Tax=Canavalia gladiata TaxID=3824 RepID=A0AAN9K084_CANGL